jgi:hypothetical protein
MNFNNIFNTFSNSEENLDEVSLPVDFSEHPLYWIGGFNKIISNNIFFIQYVIKHSKNTSPELNLEELEKIGENLMYDKAWDYIKNIKINNVFHIECLKLKADEKFLLALKTSVKHFENLEEYEKCALLKSIEIKVKDFLI